MAQETPASPVKIQSLTLKHCSGLIIPVYSNEGMNADQYILRTALLKEKADVMQANKQGHFKGEGLDIDGVRLVSTEKSTSSAVRPGIRPWHMVLDAHGPLIGTVTV